MAPVKFGDIAKVATEVLDDDYHCSGFLFKNKTKACPNAVVTTSIDVDQKGLPSKVTLKLPDLANMKGLTVDKLELDKSGKKKCEASLDSNLHNVKDLKVEVKSDLESLDKLNLGCTYSGLKDTLVILDAPALKPDAFNLELTRSFGPLTAGAKLGMANMTAPDLGVRYTSGAIFASLLCKNQFSDFLGHFNYKVNDDLKVAAFYMSAKKSNCGLGVQYKLNKDTTLKAKMTQNQDISTTCKYAAWKGFNILYGAKFNPSGGLLGYGLQVSLE